MGVHQSGYDFGPLLPGRPIGSVSLWRHAHRYRRLQLLDRIRRIRIGGGPDGRLLLEVRQRMTLGLLGLLLFMFLLLLLSVSLVLTMVVIPLLLIVHLGRRGHRRHRRPSRVRFCVRHRFRFWIHQNHVVMVVVHRLYPSGHDDHDPTK